MNRLTEQILILGYGNFGRALAEIFHRQRLVVDGWDSNPLKSPSRRRLSEIAPSASLLVVCVPSWRVRALLPGLEPIITPGTILVSTAKGIESSGATVPELYRQFLPNHPIALMSGPMLSNAIGSGGAGSAVIASADRLVARRIADLFSGSPIQTSLSADVHGTAIAGALKNAYATIKGMADGLQWGNNEINTLMQEAAAEMISLGKSLGASEATLRGTGGVDDLIVTAYAPASRNRLAGEALAAGRTPSAAEGLSSLQGLERRRPKNDQSTYPMFAALQAIANGRQSARDALEPLRRRTS